jgi:predicted regulator of Ras-like GTPase activity (Roadblock/LC7/MglB family)
MFQSMLAKLVAQTHARWAMIVGSDGVLLETDNRFFRTEADCLAAEYAAYYRASRKAAADTDMGGLLSSMLVVGQGKLLFHAITSDYVLILLLAGEEPAGKAFFEMTRLSEPLVQELSV